MGITMNDVVVFVQKAQEENLIVDTQQNSNTIFIQKDGEYIYIYTSTKKDNSHEIVMETKWGRLKLEATQPDLNLFNVLMDNVDRYSENKTIEYLNGFFKAEENKSTTDINDLDDEE